MYDCALNKQVLLTSAGLCLCLRANRAFFTWKEPGLLRADPKVTRPRQHTSLRRQYTSLRDSYPVSLPLLGSLYSPGPSLASAQGGGGRRVDNYCQLVRQTGSGSASFLYSK